MSLKTKQVSRETNSENIFPGQLDLILDALLEASPLQAFKRETLLEKSFSLSGLSLSLLYLIIAALNFKQKQIVAIHAESDAQAVLVHDGLFDLLGGSVYLFPELNRDETHIPGFEVESERYFSEAYQALDKKLPGIYIISPASLNQAVGTHESLEAQKLILRKGSIINREMLIERLSAWDYSQTDHTQTPKTFSVRGGIIDIYLLYANHPVRCEFFGDSVESIRLYNPLTQLSTGEREKLEILPPPSYQENKKNVKLENLINDLEKFWIQNQKPLYALGNEPDTNKNITINVQSIDLSKLSKEARDEALQVLIKEYPESSCYYFSALPPSHDVVRFRQIPASIPDAFHCRELKILCLTPKSLTGALPSRAVRWQVQAAGVKHEKFSNLHSINWGDYLVHQDFGVGIYRGLEKVGSSEALEENIKIEYARGGYVFVPVDRFSRVHKYIGLGESKPALALLGSAKWEKQKSATRRAAAEIVDGLVALYKTRRMPRGFAYSTDTELLEALADSFPFEETPDQAQAIDAVLDDMDKDVPLDRLIYGDVGFGKTEVALRAIMKAVSSGKIVFFLTPTTILADQHYITCKNRLDPLGVRVEMLSRFRSKKEQAAIIENLHTNQVDLLIGTHRLLSDDVTTANLGLLVIDEEHRFGVKHKETIRSLKRRVDVITLTATPIPRTLQQSLMGLRDLSKIETPPKSRIPIATWVKYFKWSQIEKAIQTELDREGQVYFLHNDINSMPFFFNKIQNLFPHCTAAMAHGRMSSRLLEKIILAFFRGEIDVLVCTTIIESGLDVTNANTIVINNAQLFGLAQLYQIRGRVGRSSRRAYCYLLLPPGKALSEESSRRLKALEHFSALGSGYEVALKDLEIRGAGNLFGYEQSGQISKVGFELYNKILKEAVDESFGKDTLDQIEKIAISFSGHALIPPAFVNLVQDRLYFYQKLSQAVSESEVRDLKLEIKDRFGSLPPETENLFELTSLKTIFPGDSFSRLKIESGTLKIAIKKFPAGLDAQTFLIQLKIELERGSLPYKIIPEGRTIAVEFSINGQEQAVAQSRLFAQLYSGLKGG
ncbi:MAG: transcription-repair coupling factor [Candidatus Neomarinimicrobiota bacterium]